VAEIIAQKRLGNIEQNRRSVDRETVGRNRKVKRINGPEIDRDVKWPTQSPQWGRREHPVRGW
jgi:hypothetical protein